MSAPPGYNEAASAGRYSLFSQYVDEFRKKLVEIGHRPTSLPEYYTAFKHRALREDPASLVPDSMRKCYKAYLDRAWDKVRLIESSNTPDAKWKLEKTLTRLSFSIRILDLIAAALRHHRATEAQLNMIWEKASPSWQNSDGDDIHTLLGLRFDAPSPAQWVEDLLSGGGTQPLQPPHYTAHSLNKPSQSSRATERENRPTFTARQARLYANELV